MAKMMRAVLTLLAGIACSNALFAATALRDINTVRAGDSFAFLTPVDLAAVTLFVFDDGTRGSELWATDGTPAGTRLVLDINPGPAGSAIRYLTVANGLAFFWADDGTNGYEVWKSDGTTAGTAIVANVTPDDRALDGPIEPPIVAVGGNVYFAANDGQSGVELWRSDGTRAGTYRLKDIAVGAASSNPEGLLALGSKLFFVADDGTSGGELWVSDGTPDGTRLTKDINAGVGSGTSAGGGQITASGNTLYFIAGSAAQGKEVWRMPASGTSPEIVEDIVPGPGTGIPRGLVRVGAGVVFAEGSQLFFAGPGGAAVRLGAMPCPGGTPETAVVTPARTLFVMNEKACALGGEERHSPVWTTDGTAAGTRPLDPDLSFIWVQGVTTSVVTSGGDAYFVAARAAAPGSITPGTTEYLWRSDGTLAGTHQLTDGAFSVITPSMAQLGGRVFFVNGTNFDPAGGELWFTDGTLAGTARLADINAGSAASMISELTFARGKILFKADDGLVGSQPWITDGTTTGTWRLRDAPVVTSTLGSNPTGFFAFAGGALFVADDGTTGTELWFTDGTVAGTRFVADIAPGAASSNPASFVSLGSSVLFLADDGVSGRELWRTDGTTVGTRRVADIRPGAMSSDPITSSFGALALNGVAYFAADDGASGQQLWRSDGTSAGTSLFVHLTTPGTAPALQIMATLAGRGIFAARVGSDPAQRLWVTDGTVAGTVPLRLDMEVASALDFAVYQGFVYFQGVDASGDHELWRSDGTAAGTTLVQDLRAGGSSNPNQFFANGAVLGFAACTGGPACSLFASHDPGSGVEQLGSFHRNGSIATDGTRLFWVDATTSPGRLVVSDGTLAGSAYVQGTLPFSGNILEYLWFSGALVMLVNDATLGPSLWVTDGTSAGTHLLADIDPRKSADQGPGGFFVMGSKLLFTGYHPSLGYEPWVLDASPNADDDSARVAFNTATRIAVLANDGDLAGRLSRSSVEIVAQPTLGTAVVDPGTGEIVYTPTTGRTGADSLRYIVKNEAGLASNVATVGVFVAQASGPTAGTAPVPPVTPPTTSTTPTTPTSPSGGGGGGAIDPMTLLALTLLVLGTFADRSRQRFAAARRRDCSLRYSGDGFR
jgi:ELWxxDGT repeat protein